MRFKAYCPLLTQLLVTYSSYRLLRLCVVCWLLCWLSGKSQFLKTLAGRMRKEKRVTGELYFNGLTADEQLAAGQYIEKMCGFIQQGPQKHTPHTAYQRQYISIRMQRNWL